MLDDDTTILGSWCLERVLLHWAPLLHSMELETLLPAWKWSRWPPVRATLKLTTIELLSLHGLPKRGERRPRLLEGRRAACHAFAPELSGAGAPPSADVGARNVGASSAQRCELAPCNTSAIFARGSVGACAHVCGLRAGG